MIEDGLKISEFTTTSTPTNNDLIPIVQSNQTMAITKEDLFEGTETKIERNASYVYGSEAIVGTWIDMKPIYRRVVDFGALPNAGQKKVAHNISNMEWLVNAYAVSMRTNQDNTHTWFPINQARPDVVENSIGLWVEDTEIAIQTGIDRSTSDETYVILEYTKTTD